MQVKNSFIRLLLYPLLPIYWTVIFVRNLLFDLKLLKIQSLGCPTISIGNLSVGGSGKTPMTVFLAKEILKKKLKVGILTRGYGRSSQNTIIICNDKEKEKNLHSSEVGDEPILLYKKLRNVPIAISKNRIKAGKMILEKYELDVILLDDGFQHRYVKRDVDILLINTLEKKSNYNLLPVGNLREPWRNIKRSDFIVLTKINLLKNENKYIYKKLKDKKNVFISEAFNILPKDINDQNTWFKKMNSKKAVLLSGIGDPKSFDISSRKLGFNIIGHIKLKDHFYYTKEKINKVLNSDKIKDADFILTTEKDMVKIDQFKINLPIISLELVFKIRGREEAKNFIELIIKKLNL